jgi:glycosyltransferase involved in cell wall biosynthesis
MIKLSLLIPTLPSRLRVSYPLLIESLLRQIGDRQDVEVLSLFDNKTRTVGEKRNLLASMAQGEYISFIDDDDEVSDDYLQYILKATETQPDLITFDCVFAMAGREPKPVYYKLEYPVVQMFSDHNIGQPCHLHVWKRSMISDIKFPDYNCAEDRPWQSEAVKRPKSVVQIDKILYFYRFNPETSETLKHRNG